MQYLGGEHGELAVFDKFAEVEEAALGRFGDLFDKGDDGVDDGAFEVEATLLAQEVGEEADQDTMLSRVGETQTLEGTDNGDLVLIRDF